MLSAMLRLPAQACSGICMFAGWSMLPADEADDLFVDAPKLEGISELPLSRNPTEIENGNGGRTAYLFVPLYDPKLARRQRRPLSLLGPSAAARSAVAVSALPPALRISSTTRRACALPCPWCTRSWPPAFARARALERPMPREAPVPRAVLPRATS